MDVPSWAEMDVLFQARAFPDEYDRIGGLGGAKLSACPNPADEYGDPSVDGDLTARVRSEGEGGGNMREDRRLMRRCNSFETTT